MNSLLIYGSNCDLLNIGCFSLSNSLPCLKLGLPTFLSNIICANCLSLFIYWKVFQLFLFHLNLKMFYSIHGDKIHFAFWYPPLTYFQLSQWIPYFTVFIISAFLTPISSKFLKYSSWFQNFNYGFDKECTS